MKSVESGSGGIFQYPLQYLFVWALLLAYGVAVLLDATPRIVPAWVVLVVLVAVMHVAQRVLKTRVRGKNTISPPTLPVNNQ